MTQKIIVVGRETVVSSLAKSAGTFAMFACLIGIGIWADSSPMEWAGFLIGIFWLLDGTGRTVSKHRLTFDEARAEIDRLEAEHDG